MVDARTVSLIAVLLLCASAALAAPVIPPDCPNPAPYSPAPAGTCAAPAHIVSLRDGVDAVATTREIEQRCGFSGSEVHVFSEAFVNVVTPGEIACIRCDPRVVIVEESFLVAIPGFPEPHCEPPPIPTVGELGSVALAALLAIAGLVLVTRRGL
jgi:hypothetical protein